MFYSRKKNRPNEQIKSMFTSSINDDINSDFDTFAYDEYEEFESNEVLEGVNLI